MATFQDNINTINTAIYGKEMRPAISEALSQSWSAVQTMMGSVDQLNRRIDNLPSGGGGGGSSEPTKDSIIPPALVVYGFADDATIAGSAIISSI